MMRVIWAIAWTTLCGGLCSGLKIQTSSDLKQAISLTIEDQSGCIRLLQADGTIGCSAHKAGRLLAFNGYNLNKIRGPTVLVANESFLSTMIQEIYTRNVSDVSGILVMREQTVSDGNMDSIFPQSQYALYPDKQYPWNSRGSGIMWENLDFGIQYLSAEIEEQVLARAKDNSNKDEEVVAFEADMDATMSGESNSAVCLEQGKCDPLGGYSVVGWMPQDIEPKLPTTLLLAQMDGIGIVHDMIVGADSPMSGLAALLAAIEFLAAGIDQAKMSRRIAFAVLAGEPWGYMGSKSLLWQMHQGIINEEAFSLENIDQIVEIGSVGRTSKMQNGSSQIYMHHQKPGSGYGNVSVLEDQIRSAGLNVQNIVVSSASEKNPGIPPSSLSSFLRVNSSIQGIVLTDYDREYSNRHYATSNDLIDKLKVDGIVATAELLLQFLATEIGQPLKQIPLQALRDRVTELIGCLAKSGAILQCQLAKDLIFQKGQQSNYVGILQLITEDPQDPDVRVKSDMARFVWNFLGNVSSSGKVGNSKGEEGGCTPGENPCADGAICVGYHINEKPGSTNGQCQKASVRYIESRSTKLECKGCSVDSMKRWTMANTSDAWSQEFGWPEDPIWTESRWEGGVPQVRVYQEDLEATEIKVLIAGVALVTVSILFAFVARSLDASQVSNLRVFNAF